MSLSCPQHPFDVLRDHIDLEIDPRSPGYGAEHGQHISFYRKSTLQYLAKKHGKQLVSNEHDYHLFSDKPMSELRWLTILLSKRFMNFAARFLLKSKVLSDHLLMNRRD